MGGPVNVLVLTMRVFLSLPWKILGLLSVFLLLASLIIGNSWINKNDQDFLTQQQQLLHQDKQQFTLINTLLRHRIETWFESFIHFQANYGDTIEATSLFLQLEQDYLQLHWLINNIWLYDTEKSLYFSSMQQTPPELLEDVRQVFEQQNSTSRIICTPRCEQYFNMPILVNKGNIAVLTVSISLQQTLAALNRATLANMAVVSLPQGASPSQSFQDLQIEPPIAESQQQFVQALLDDVTDKTNVAQVLRNGHRIRQQANTFLVNLLPLDENDKSDHYLLFVHDISESSALHSAFQKRVLWISIIVTIISLLTFFWLTHRLRKRLLSITRTLPLLAEKRYQQFRQHQYIGSELFSDEIDNLQMSASRLGDELESLDQKIENNTRELENIAMYDKLTGLASRNLLTQKLREYISALANHKASLAVMFLDFDNFRKINDTHGHNIGDSFLIEAAKRIKTCVESDNLICRFGGDEFVIVLPQQTLQQTIAVAEKLLIHFRAPMLLVGQRFYITTSIGIVETNQANAEVDDLIRKADMAMYASKDDGGDRYRVFDHQMYQLVIHRMQMESEVRIALEHEQFSFALQPQIEINSGKLVGFEALIRWIHPDKGFIPPDEFIPILENSENMIQLGYWGLRRAFIILSKMEQLGFKHQRIAVNLSAVQLLDPNLLPFLKQLLIDFNRDGSQIELELTERTVVADIENTLTIMSDLRRLGFTFSIDDFGTGYSSLAYLKQMPVDIIKIDRSFISGMADRQADRQIVSSIIAMIQKLGMKVVAEGVETLAQLNMLKEMNCEIGQGYFIAKPIMETELYDLMPDMLKNGIWDNMDKV